MLWIFFLGSCILYAANIRSLSIYGTLGRISGWRPFASCLHEGQSDCVLRSTAWKGKLVHAADNSLGLFIFLFFLFFFFFCCMWEIGPSCWNTVMCHIDSNRLVKVELRTSCFDCVGAHSALKWYIYCRCFFPPLHWGVGHAYHGCYTSANACIDTNRRSAY